ncbi:hypothetical protein TGDOM2_399770, partial [Toxoplasma gondii GAB2-2007-GAL-DOM2]
MAHHRTYAHSHITRLATFLFSRLHQSYTAQDVSLKTFLSSVIACLPVSVDGRRSTPAKSGEAPLASRGSTLILFRSTIVPLSFPCLHSTSRPLFIVVLATAATKKDSFSGLPVFSTHGSFGVTVSHSELLSPLSRKGARLRLRKATKGGQGNPTFVQIPAFSTQKGRSSAALFSRMQNMLETSEPNGGHEEECRHTEATSAMSSLNLKALSADSAPVPSLPPVRPVEGTRFAFPGCVITFDGPCKPEDPRLPLASACIPGDGAAPGVAPSAGDTPKCWGGRYCWPPTPAPPKWAFPDACAWPPKIQLLNLQLQLLHLQVPQLVHLLQVLLRLRASLAAFLALSASCPAPSTPAAVLPRERRPAVWRPRQQLLQLMVYVLQLLLVVHALVLELHLDALHLEEVREIHLRALLRQELLPQKQLLTYFDAKTEMRFARRPQAQTGERAQTKPSRPDSFLKRWPSTDEFRSSRGEPLPLLPQREDQQGDGPELPRAPGKFASGVVCLSPLSSQAPYHLRPVSHRGEKEREQRAREHRGRSQRDGNEGKGEEQKPSKDMAMKRTRESSSPSDLVPRSSVPSSSAWWPLLFSRSPASSSVTSLPSPSPFCPSSLLHASSLSFAALFSASPSFLDSSRVQSSSTWLFPEAPFGPLRLSAASPRLAATRKSSRSCEAPRLWPPLRPQSGGKAKVRLPFFSLGLPRAAFSRVSSVWLLSAKNGDSALCSEDVEINRGQWGRIGAAPPLPPAAA